LIGDKTICYEKKQGKYKEYYSIKEPVMKAIRAYTDDILYIVDESDDEHTESVKAAAITTAENIPKRLFNLIS
jgi:hypothetical protein